MELKAWTGIALVLAGCLSLAADAIGHKLTTAELEQGRVYLQQTRNYVIGATKGLSEAQWKFKPAPNRWSIAEIVEHMALTQDVVMGPIREQLAKSAAVTGERDYKQVDAMVVNQLPDRTAKFQAPEFLQPTGRWEPSVALDRVLKNYARIGEYLESTPDLRQHLVEAPPIKAVSKGAFESMDGYQWVLATAAHTERHTKQILEVKADPNFPVK
ncbi:MAG: DinB family protein [Acidobacteriota bacterium]|nr:DinB family protein [Acidobacteriota bacterium]